MNEEDTAGVVLALGEEQMNVGNIPGHHMQVRSVKIQGQEGEGCRGNKAAGKWRPNHSEVILKAQAGPSKEFSDLA